MIPRASITAWRAKAPWPEEALVEQDLVLSRIMVDLFADERIQSAFAMRGGTALHKLVLGRPLRYSEDIDLVQVRPGPIRPFFDALHERVDPWLGHHRYRHGPHSVRVVYAFQAETRPPRRLRVKVEANAREHFAVLGLVPLRHRVESPWFTGEADVHTFRLEELLATKLRALYQRKKGRDLFDLHVAGRAPGLQLDKVPAVFRAYLERQGLSPSRAELGANLDAKLGDPDFRDDVLPFLAVDASYDVHGAATWVLENLIQRLD